MYDQFQELLGAFEFVCFMRFSACQQDGTPAPLLNFLSPKEHPSDDSFLKQPVGMLPPCV